MASDYKALEVLCSTLVLMTGNDHDIMRSYVSSMVHGKSGIEFEQCQDAQETVVAILKEISPGFDLRDKDQILEDAQQAFWNVIAEAYGVKETSFPIDATMKFDEACKVAVETWLETSVI